MNAARRTVAIVTGGATLLMGFIAITVPMIVATTPAVFTLGLGLATWAIWPNRKTTS